MRVLVVVTHLLGTGHLSRALTLARAFAGKGHEAHVASGGVAVPALSSEDLTLHQLPAVKSDGINFTTLLTGAGDPVGDAFLAARKAEVLAVLARVKPDVLVTELYPFGRRILKGEFLALLNAARGLENPPAVFASIRDILAPPSKPQKALETEAVIAGYYDGVLVHSDPEKTPLSASWPVSEAMEERLRYTGYVAPAAPGLHPDGAGVGEILVTAGGGDVGQHLFRTALAAAPLAPDLRWRLLVGGSNKESFINELEAISNSDNVTIEGTRPDFRQMMTRAKAVVSMCGYNTAMDVLQTAVPAVFVPFDDGGETEQPLRAQSLARQAGISVLPAAELTAEALVAALRRVLEDPSRQSDPDQFNGAEKAVEIVQDFVANRGASDV